MRWALSPSDWGPQEMRTQTCTHRDDHVRMQEERASQEGGSGHQPNHTWVSDIYPQG